MIIGICAAVLCAAVLFLYARSKAALLTGSGDPGSGNMLIPYPDGAELVDFSDVPEGAPKSPKGLTCYQYSCGGNELGNDYTTEIRKQGDAAAILSISKADWHAEDPRVEEYLVDQDVLKSIEEIFLKYEMQKWHNREFSDVFICDGETESYFFTFENGKVHFSSQLFPTAFKEKLAEIDQVVKTAKSEGEKLPGLVLPERSEEEIYAARYPEDNKIHTEVYSYCRDYLAFRIANGTEEDQTIDESYAVYLLKEDGSEEQIYEEKNDYDWTIEICGGDCYEDSLKMEKRLEAGRYRLEIGNVSCEFEMR